MMNEQQCELIFNYAATKDIENINRVIGFDVVNQPKSVLPILEKAALSNDPEEIECALLLLFIGGPFLEAAPVLTNILSPEWHYKHEDIVLALQTLRAPIAVDTLFQVALEKYDYLKYDEFYGLARKCTWALADIGTPEAYEKLLELAKCGNPVIEGYAQRKIDLWMAEIARKGYSFIPD